MICNKNLAELGKEYQEAALVIQERLATRNRILEQLRKEGLILSDKAFVIKGEISTLEREYEETVATAHKLLNYYNNGDKK